jgi:hypothetical protein
MVCSGFLIILYLSFIGQHIAGDAAYRRRDVEGAVPYEGFVLRKQLRYQVSDTSSGL